jgi:hypothetical protein
MERSRKTVAASKIDGDFFFFWEEVMELKISAPRCG